MARVSIEQELWSDPRFLILQSKIGKQRAAGAVLLAFHLAQKFWAMDKRLIPLSVWKSEKMEKKLLDSDVKFAEQRGESIYIFGSEKHFGWIFTRRENGKLGGRPKVNNNIDITKPKHNLEDTFRVTENTNICSDLCSDLQEPKRNPLTLTLPLSLSPSFKKEEENTSTLRIEEPGQVLIFENEVEKPKKENLVGEFLGVYREAWKERYETNPEITGRMGAAAKRIIKDLGIDKAKDLVRSYLRMSDQWFMKKGHDLATFESSLNTIRAFHDTGKTNNAITMRHDEERDHFRNQLERIERGEI